MACSTFALTTLWFVMEAVLYSPATLPPEDLDRYILLNKIDKVLLTDAIEHINNDLGQIEKLKQAKGYELSRIQLRFPEKDPARPTFLDLIDVDRKPRGMEFLLTHPKDEPVKIYIESDYFMQKVFPFIISRLANKPLPEKLTKEEERLAERADARPRFQAMVVASSILLSTQQGVLEKELARVLAYEKALHKELKSREAKK